MHGRYSAYLQRHRMPVVARSSQGMTSSLLPAESGANRGGRGRGGRGRGRGRGRNQRGGRGRGRGRGRNASASSAAAASAEEEEEDEVAVVGEEQLFLIHRAQVIRQDLKTHWTKFALLSMPTGRVYHTTIAENAMSCSCPEYAENKERTESGRAIVVLGGHQQQQQQQQQQQGDPGVPSVVQPEACNHLLWLLLTVLKVGPMCPLLAGGLPTRGDVRRFARKIADSDLRCHPDVTQKYLQLLRKAQKQRRIVLRAEGKDASVVDDDDVLLEGLPQRSIAGVECAICTEFLAPAEEEEEEDEEEDGEEDPETEPEKASSRGRPAVPRCTKHDEKCKLLKRAGAKIYVCARPQAERCMTLIQVPKKAKRAVAAASPVVAAPPQETVHCRFGCGQSIHKACFEHWEASERKAKRVGKNGKVKLECIYCRSPWNLLDSSTDAGGAVHGGGDAEYLLLGPVQESAEQAEQERSRSAFLERVRASAAYNGDSSDDDEGSFASNRIARVFEHVASMIVRGDS
jgi:hypothetical protein